MLRVLLAVLVATSTGSSLYGTTMDGVFSAPRLPHACKEFARNNAFSITIIILFASNHAPLALSHAQRTAGTGDRVEDWRRWIIEAKADAKPYPANRFAHSPRRSNQSHQQYLCPS